jgi:hypothetical protein
MSKPDPRRAKTAHAENFEEPSSATIPKDKPVYA